MKSSRLLLALGGAFSLLLFSGCALFGTAVPEFDVTKTSCEEIAEARNSVQGVYKAKLEIISDAYYGARRLFEKEMRDCQLKVHLENPCEAEWQDLQDAYQTARGDISNDEAYDNYKAKKSTWEACSENYRNDPDSFYDKSDEKLLKCQQEYQAKISQAQEARQSEDAKAKAKRDADLAYLDELEEKCKKTPEPTPTPAIIIGGGGASPTPAVTTGGGTTTGGGCRIPGEYGTPRTGKPDDNVVKETATEIAVQVAEAITGSPIPSSAINDRVFAGIVCTKLYARELELQQDEVDAIMSGNRREQIRLRRLMARYRRAKLVWCAIAEGRTDARQARAEVNSINSMPWGPEPGSELCAIIPTGSVTPPPNPTVMAISYGGSFIPVTSVRKVTGQECDGDEHWHGHGQVAALDGRKFTDPNPDGCGFGKTSVLQPVEVAVFAPSSDMRIEVRMGI